jgi:hypothetical protein
MWGATGFNVHMVIVWTSILLSVVGIVSGIVGLIWRPHEAPGIAVALIVLGVLTLSFLYWKWSRK